jgi:uncharacterized protein YdhG (YjbR/CyaY superfamily)
VSFKTVDEYIAAQPAQMQQTLRRVRAAIREGIPGADEVIAYNIPSYKVGGVSVLHFALSKKHYALYGASAAIVEAFKDELAGCTIDKGTIRFSLVDPVPESLIRRIAKFRLDNLDAGGEKTLK